MSHDQLHSQLDHLVSDLGHVHPVTHHPQAVLQGYLIDWLELVICLVVQPIYLSYVLLSDLDLQDVKIRLKVESPKEVVQIVTRLTRLGCINVLEKCQKVLCNLVVTVEHGEIC